MTTIIDKLDGSDRTTAKRRQQLGLEPKRKDWRPAAKGAPAKARDRSFRERPRVVKEAKGLK